MLSPSDSEDFIELPPLEEHFGFAQTNVFESAKKDKNMVMRACVHCKRLHAKCSNERPCHRCVHTGLASSCEDSPRKPRVPKSKEPGSKFRTKHAPHISVFSNPANLVMTALDGQTTVLPALLLEENDPNDIFIPFTTSRKRPLSLISPITDDYSPAMKIERKYLECDANSLKSESFMDVLAEDQLHSPFALGGVQ